MNAAMFLLAAGRDADVAIEAGEQRLTYGELRGLVARAAAAWRALGLAPGDRVLVFAPDSIRWVVAWLGAVWAGGVAVGLNSRLFERDVSVILEESGARFVLCDPDSADIFERLAHDLPDRPVAIVAGREWDVRVAGTTPMRSVERAHEDMAFWLYTSGTTGRPKGVVHAQRAVRAASAFAEQVLGLGRADRLYASSKLFFAYALGNSLFAGLALGATIVLDEDWPTAERVGEMVAKHCPTVLFSVPTLYLKMLQTGVATTLAGVRRFVSAGEALPPAVRKGWRAAAGITPVSGYGTTETLLLMLHDADDAGALARSPFVECRLPDPPPTADTPHRLWFRHPSVALGYWQRPDAEADAFHDGWFSPGDLFIAGADGRFAFCGRDDDMLKVSGQWVSVLEVEQALMAACSGTVRELAAVGFDNRNGLTSIALFCVAIPGSEAAAEAKLGEGIAKLPGFKRPREIRWIGELPKTATGKLQRRTLRSDYLDGM